MYPYLAMNERQRSDVREPVRGLCASLTGEDSYTVEVIINRRFGSQYLIYWIRKSLLNMQGLQ